MGFRSLATAIYTRDLITQVVLNESHGILNPKTRDMRHFQERLNYHK
jgi:hypothetical protein